MQLTPEVKRRRARIGALKHHNPEAAAAESRDMLVDNVALDIKKLVEGAPPLTDEQRRTLRRLLAPARGGA